jgi:ADP-ribose pyrophosphatase
MSELNWKVLDSTYLVNAPWAVLRKDICQMPSGYIVPEYYVLEYPNWVNIVAITADNEFVLVKQYRHGISAAVLEIPGGVIDKGEDALEAAKREMLEETGYSFSSFEKLCELFPNPATSNNITTTYLAKGGVKIQEQQLDAQEEIQIILASPEEVRNLLFENKFGQALHSAAMFYGLNKLGML